MGTPPTRFLIEQRFIPQFQDFLYSQSLSVLFSLLLLFPSKSFHGVMALEDHPFTRHYSKNRYRSFYILTIYSTIFYQKSPCSLEGKKSPSEKVWRI